MIPEDQFPSVHLKLSRAFKKLVPQLGTGSFRGDNSQNEASIFVLLRARFSANNAVNL